MLICNVRADTRVLPPPPYPAQAQTWLGAAKPHKSDDQFQSPGPKPRGHAISRRAGHQQCGLVELGAASRSDVSVASGNLGGQSKASSMMPQGRWRGSAGRGGRARVRFGKTANQNRGGGDPRLGWKPRFAKIANQMRGGGGQERLVMSITKLEQNSRPNRRR